MTKPSPDGRDGDPVVLVGTDAGVYRTAPDAGPWLAERGSVRSLAASADGGLLVAGFGMRGAGVWASRDGGGRWEPFPGWPADREAWSVTLRADGGAWVGSQPADLWQRDREGAWRTSDSIRAIPERARWDFIVPPYEAHLLHVAERPERRGAWAAAVEQGGILESLDDGATWRQASPVWDAHRVVHARDGSLLAATGDGLHRRAPGATSWTPAGVDGYVTGLTRDDAGALYAATGDDARPIVRSDDDGRTWRAFGPADLPPPGTGVHALAAVPGSPGVVVHGADSGVWIVTADAARVVASGLPTVRRVLVRASGGLSHRWSAS